MVVDLTAADEHLILELRAIDAALFVSMVTTRSFNVFGSSITSRAMIPAIFRTLSSTSGRLVPLREARRADTNLLCLSRNPISGRLAMS